MIETALQTSASAVSVFPASGSGGQFAVYE